MPYIGKSPVGGGFHKLDNLTASATDTYALTLGSAAYYPETANQLLVSLNGVIQAPQDSFTVSGSNLIFDSALTSSDSIDFVVALGDVLGVGSVSDGAITTAKIGNQAVTMDKLATSGTLPALDGSALTGISSGVKQTVVHQETTVKTDGHVFASSGTAYRLMSAANAVDSTSKMEVTITPSSASSKILISVSCFFEPNTSSHDIIWTLYRNTSTRLGQADDSNRRGGIANTITSLDSNNDSTMDSVNFIFQDTPNSTSATTYTLAFSAGASTNLFLNRTVAYGDSSGIERAVSLIMAQEI